MAEQGFGNFVEVSAHTGARSDGSGGAADHAAWQGKVYHRGGRIYYKGEWYEDCVQATGYGTGEGLCGWNCRHNFHPFWPGISKRNYTNEQLAAMNEANVPYNGKLYTRYEINQMQRALERKVRTAKRKYLAESAAGVDASRSAVRLKAARQQLNNFIRATGGRADSSRTSVAGFGRSAASKATWSNRKIIDNANRYFNLKNTQANVSAYLKNKSTIDLLNLHGVKYLRRISDKEVIVDAGRPTIQASTQHAADNLQSKPDRAEMTVERAQSFVDNCKLTLFQCDRETLKFMADDGYAVLNFSHELVTAVPQKWRKKYDQYLEGKDVT